MEDADALTGGFGAKKRRDTQLKKIAQYNSDTEEGEKLPRKFDRVLATLGFMVASRESSLEWGLVTLYRGRSGTEKQLFEAQRVRNAFGMVTQVIKLKIGDTVVRGGVPTWLDGGTPESYKVEDQIPTGRTLLSNEVAKLGGPKDAPTTSSLRSSYRMVLRKEPLNRVSLVKVESSAPGAIPERGC